MKFNTTCFWSDSIIVYLAIALTKQGISIFCFNFSKLLMELLSCLMVVLQLSELRFMHVIT
jgi:hypothetical protein